MPDGLEGKLALLACFRKLLAANPRWEWTQVEGIPMADGFLNKWKARIPVGTTTLEVVGVCLVQLDAAGRIRRNEVYFDRTPLLQEIARAGERSGVAAWWAHLDAFARRLESPVRVMLPPR